MSKKSSSSSSSSTNTNTKNVNVQGVQGTSVFTDGNVTVTDAGAVEGSLQIGQDAVAAITDLSAAFLDAQTAQNERALSLSEGIAAGVDDYAGKVTELAKTAATDDTAETIQTMIKWGAGAAIVIGGVIAMKKGK